MARLTQKQQVIEALEREGGYATLRRLNEVLDFSGWATKTPEASVRRIVQDSDQIFKIQPGLWALESRRDEVLRRFRIREDDRRSVERFSHGYYQGLLVEIGRYKDLQTYVPAQDQHRVFLDKNLGDVADLLSIPPFTYEHLLRRARTIDVIWFNKRGMPSDCYEVEHTTDIKNSLSKYYELQDFAARFYIVADASRRREFEDKLHVSMFDEIASRVQFIDYERVVSLYNGLRSVESAGW